MGILQSFPPTRAHSLATALLERHSAQEIADAIEVLIDVLDALGGDPDLEDDDPAGRRGRHKHWQSNCLEAWAIVQWPRLRDRRRGLRRAGRSLKIPIAISNRFITYGLKQ